jgi:hypothetical protein
MYCGTHSASAKTELFRQTICREEAQESALVTTLGVIEAKLNRARAKLAEAEGVVSAQLQSVRSQFNSLFQVFRLWHIEREKKKLLGQMDGYCRVFSVDQVVVHSRVIVDLVPLEITAQDAEARHTHPSCAAVVTNEVVCTETILDSLHAISSFAGSISGHSTYPPSPYSADKSWF